MHIIYFKNTRIKYWAQNFYKSDDNDGGLYRGKSLSLIKSNIIFCVTRGLFNGAKCPLPRIDTNLAAPLFQSIVYPPICDCPFVSSLPVSSGFLNT